MRNSEQSVVQFRYGDDGLNPQARHSLIMWLPALLFLILTSPPLPSLVPAQMTFSAC